MQIDDLTSTGFVRRWELDACGRPCCPLDAIAATESGAVAVLQRNAAIRVLAAEAEAIEAARRVLADESADADAHGAAEAAIAAATAPALALADWRAGDDTKRDAVLAALTTEAATPLAVDPRPVPLEVPLWALQAALKISGKYDAIDAFALAQRDANPVVYFAWTMGNVVSWGSALVAQFEPQFGIDMQARANLFRSAAALAAQA